MSLGMSAGKRKARKDKQPQTQQSQTPYFPPGGPVPVPPTVPTSQTKSQRRWSPEMIELMLDSLLEEVARSGRSCNNGFKSVSLKGAATAVNTKLGMEVNNENVRSKLKTLKKDYLIARALLEASGFGFSFNVDTKGIDAEPDAWERYIEAHPEARNHRGKIFPYYEQMSILVGDDTATGEDNVTGCDPETTDVFNLEVDDEDNDEEGGTDGEFVDLEDTPAQHPSSGGAFGSGEHLGESTATADSRRTAAAANSSSPSVVLPKRKKPKFTMADIPEPPSFKGLMEAVQVIAQSFAKPKISILSDAVKEVTGGNRDLYMRAMDMLGADKDAASIFLGMDPDVKAEWLLRKLN